MTPMTPMTPNQVVTFVATPQGLVTFLCDACRSLFLRTGVGSFVDIIPAAKKLGIKAQMGSAKAEPFVVQFGGARYSVFIVTTSEEPEGFNVLSWDCLDSSNEEMLPGICDMSKELLTKVRIQALLRKTREALIKGAKKAKAEPAAQPAAPTRKVA